MACCTQCANFAGCTYFTYAPDDWGGTCWFKDNNGGQRTKSGCVSGGLSAGPAPPPGPITRPASGAKPMAIGTILILVVVCGMVLPYFVVGVIVQRRRGAAGLDSIPNREFWASLPGLIGTGCAFTFGGLRKKVRSARGYAAYESL